MTGIRAMGSRRRIQSLEPSVPLTGHSCPEDATGDADGRKPSSRRTLVVRLEGGRERGEVETKNGAGRKRSVAREMTAGLHLPISRTGWTAVDDVAVVTENARELLRYVRSAVSTSSTGCRRFHGLPIVFCGVHGL